MKGSAPAADGKGSAGGKAKGAKAKGAKAGDRPPNTRRPRRHLVHDRHVALGGLAGLTLIAVMMLRCALDLVAAGQRAAVLLVVVLLVDHVALPVCRSAGHWWAHRPRRTRAPSADRSRSAR